MKSIKNMLNQYPVLFMDRGDHIDIHLGAKMTNYEQSISFCFGRYDGFDKPECILMGIDLKGGYAKTTTINGIEIQYNTDETLEYWKSEISDIRISAKKLKKSKLKILDRAFSEMLKIATINHKYKEEKALQFAIKILSEGLYNEIKDWDTENELEPYIEHITNVEWDDLPCCEIVKFINSQNYAFGMDFNSNDCINLSSLDISHGCCNVPRILSGLD